MIQWYQLVLLIGSSARVTRLVTRDTITRPLRDMVLFNRAQRRARRAGQPVPAPARPRAARVRAWLHSLITCDWCSGVWVAEAKELIRTWADSFNAHNPPAYEVPDRRTPRSRRREVPRPPREPVQETLFS